jgi:uncharacterized membrane protein YkvA (DUF1232 family)
MGKISATRGWSFRQQILTLFYAFKDDRTPWYAKVTSLSSIIYLLSPADLLPDVIPFAGYIDDLFVVPFLVNISTKLLPQHIKTAAELKAQKNSRRFKWLFILLIVLIVGLLVLLFFAARQLFE